MSVPDEYSIFCTKCDCYNVSDIACGDCVEEIKKKAHQAGIECGRQRVREEILQAIEDGIDIVELEARL